MKEKVCCFAGHSCKYYGDMRSKIEKIIEGLILEGFTIFYDGWHGSFDEICREICYSLQQKYPHIKVVKCLCNYSSKVPYEDFNIQDNLKLASETIFFNLEMVHPKAKITERNKQMVESCDCLVCYVERSFNSGAYKMVRFAKKLNKRIISIR